MPPKPPAGGSPRGKKALPPSAATSGKKKAPSAAASAEPRPPGKGPWPPAASGGGGGGKAQAPTKQPIGQPGGPQRTSGKGPAAAPAGSAAAAAPGAASSTPTKVTGPKKVPAASGSNADGPSSPSNAPRVKSKSKGSTPARQQRQAAAATAAAASPPRRKVEEITLEQPMDAPDPRSVGPEDRGWSGDITPEMLAFRDVEPIPLCETGAEYDQEYGDIARLERFVIHALFFALVGLLCFGVSVYRPYWYVGSLTAGPVSASSLHLGIARQCQNGDCGWYSYTSSYTLGRCTVADDQMLDRLARTHAVNGFGVLLCIVAMVLCFVVSADVTRINTAFWAAVLCWAGVAFTGGGAYLGYTTVSTFVFCGAKFCDVATIVSGQQCGEGIGDAFWVYVAAVAAFFFAAIALTVMRRSVGNVIDQRLQEREVAEEERVVALQELKAARKQKEALERQRILDIEERERRAKAMEARRQRDAELAEERRLQREADLERRREQQDAAAEQRERELAARSAADAEKAAAEAEERDRLEKERAEERRAKEEELAARERDYEERMAKAAAEEEAQRLAAEAMLRALRAPTPPPEDDGKPAWVMDNESGLYVESASGCYWDPVSRQYYDPATRLWTARDPTAELGVSAVAQKTADYADTLFQRNAALHRSPAIFQRTLDHQRANQRPTDPRINPITAADLDRRREEEEAAQRSALAVSSRAGSMLSPDMPTVVAQSTRDGRSLNAIRLSTSTVNVAPDALSRSRYADPGGDDAVDRSLNVSAVPRAMPTPGRTPSRVDFSQSSATAPSPAVRRRTPQRSAGDAAPTPTLQATESVRYFRPGQNDWARSRD